MFFKRAFEWLKLPSAARLALLQGVVQLTALLLFLALALWSVRRDLTEASRRRMQEELTEFAALYDQGGMAALKVAANAQPRDEGHRMVRITSPGGRVLLEAETSGYSWVTLTPFYLASGEMDWHILKHPVRNEKLIVGRMGLGDGGHLWYARRDDEELAAAGGVVQRLFWLGCLAALLGLVPVAWFVQRVLQPLQTLIRGAQRVATGPSTARLQAPAAIPELAEFADSFNASLERIAQLTGELHSVNEHLAHELRTPLARIRGNLENLLDHYGTPDGEEAAVLGMEEIDRATHLVQSILAIRLGDSGAMRLHLELTSPFELVSDLVQLYAPAAEVREQTISFDAESDGLVLLDRQRVRQAVTNLLDNALAYTPAGGHISLIQIVDAKGFQLHVQDTGPGLTQDDELRIWRRFARGSAASATTPGTGIGLALVRAVARAHFGEAGARNREEGGAEFWIKLPLTPDIE